MKKWKRIVSLGIFTIIFLSMGPNENVHAKVKISSKSVNLIVGKTKTIKIKGTDKKVKWSSSNKNVATVKKGKVKAIKKGKTTIIAKVNGKKYKCKVRVYNTAKQAETAVRAFCLKQDILFRYAPAKKEERKYVVWVTYTMTDVKAKYIVNPNNGKVVSYAPYLSVDESDNNKVKEYEFNAFDFLK